jgi:hypothetical protein
MRNLLIAATALAAIATASSASAAALVATTQARASDPEGGPGQSDLDHVVASFFPGQRPTGQVHASSEAGGFGALAVAEATADFGVNQAFARASSPDLNLQFLAPVAAFASSTWSDELTIDTSASGGFVEVGFQFHAFASQSSYDDAGPSLEYYVQWRDFFSGNQVTYYRIDMDGNGDTRSFVADGFELTGDNDDDVLRIVGIRVPFTANRAFGISSTLGCQARAPYIDANVQTCNASSTALWGGITRVTDASGNVLNDWSVRSTTGTDYTVSLIPPTVSVPEPATWAMLILGFGAAGSLIRRRRALAV